MPSSKLVLHLLLACFCAELQKIKKMETEIVILTPVLRNNYFLLLLMFLTPDTEHLEFRTQKDVPDSCDLKSRSCIAGFLSPFRPSSELVLHFV